MTFLHSGKLGDIVYALACIPKGSTLYLTNKPWLTDPLTQENFDFIRSLIPMQWWAGEKIDHDFTGFRMHYRKGVNLAQQQADYVGLKMTRPWLTVNNPIPSNCPIVSRSVRYHHPNGRERWIVELSKHRRFKFIGTAFEHQVFCDTFQCSCELLYTPSMEEIARYIAGAPMFIGNQSLPLSLAVALGRPCIVEHCPSWDDCRFDGATYPLA